MSEQPNASTPRNEQSLEGLLERFVYFPVGLVSAVVSAAPQAAESGKALLEGQIKTAEFLGKMTVGYVKNRVQSPEGAVREVGAMVLNAFGDRLPPGVTDLISKVMTTQETSAPGSVDADAHLVENPPSEKASSDHGNDDSASPEVGGLAAYDTLTASQAIAEFARLSDAQLSEIEVYELEHRRRRTILAKISQLRDSRSKSD
jgi:hypothetical protein